jgi:hypothetical protein
MRVNEPVEVNQMPNSCRAMTYLQMACVPAKENTACPRSELLDTRELL